MSPVDYKSQRMGRTEALKLVRKIANGSPGNVGFSGHALAEMEADELTTVDIWNVLKSPDSRIHTEGELERASYRYRLETEFILVVVAFWPDGSGFSVVTVWDKRKKGK